MYVVQVLIIPEERELLEKSSAFFSSSLVVASFYYTVSITKATKTEQTTKTSIVSSDTKICCGTADSTTSVSTRYSQTRYPG